MKFKVVVVDLELSPRARRLSAWAGAAALVLGAATVAYASVPVTFSAGTTLHAADLNQNFTSLDQRIAALENAPKAPRYFQMTIEANGTVFESSTNISANPLIEHTTTGVYHILWKSTDFPNGVAPVITPSLGNPESLQMSELSTGTNDCYVVTLNPAGVATDGWFTVLLIGQ